MSYELKPYTIVTENGTQVRLEDVFQIHINKKDPWFKSPKTKVKPVATPETARLKFYEFCESIGIGGYSFRYSDLLYKNLPKDKPAAVQEEFKKLQEAANDEEKLERQNDHTNEQLRKDQSYRDYDGFVLKNVVTVYVNTENGPHELVNLEYDSFDEKWVFENHGAERVVENNLTVEIAKEKIQQEIDGIYEHFDCYLACKEKE